MQRHRPGPIEVPRSSASAFVLARDPRVLHIIPDYTELRPIKTPAIEPPLTVVVTVTEVDYFVETLRALATQDYDNFTIIIVCLRPDDETEILSAIAAHKAYLPKTRLLTLKTVAWEADGLNAVLPQIETEYWCWVRAADILHTKALQCVANAILAEEADYYCTYRYIMLINSIVRPLILPNATGDQVLWRGDEFPYDKLITYRRSTVAALGGFVSYDKYPGDTAWIMAYKMRAADKKVIHIPQAVYFEREPAITTKPEVEAADYRKALLLQHWPQHFVEEADIDIIKQLLEQADDDGTLDA